MCRNIIVLMLDNNSDSFCPVCRQAIERMILFNIEESL